MGRQRLRIVTFLMALGVVAMVPACAEKAAPAPQPTDVGQSTVSFVASTPSRPDHVVVVIMENKNAQDVLAAGSYLRSLADAGASLTDMHAEAHPSQPNYLALFSGDTQGVTDDSCPQAFHTPSLAGELGAAGESFVGYAEDLPQPGFTGCRAGGYARKHGPWTDFADVPPGASLPLSAMPTDFSQLPTVSFVVPNLCHDMHDCSVGVGNRWLAQNIDPYAQWARTHNSLLILTFDESEADGDRDNHIATVAVGEHVTPGPVTERTDHYGLLRTIEDLYGLRPLGRSAEATRITSLWQTGT
jgi:phosphatidylinositol-3-phosphatase